MGNLHTKYGNEKEPFAIKQFEDEHNINSCGLFVDDEEGIFGASPDGLIESNAIVEVKCPSTASR